MTFKNKNLKKLGSRTLLVAAFCIILSIVLMLPSMVLPSINGVKAAEGDVKKTTYYPDFQSFEEEQKSAAELNERLSNEGFVLLKNENKTLPLASTQRRVTALGKGSSNLVLGGAGSGGGSGDGAVTFIDGLEASGFIVNPLINQLYANTEQLQFSVSGAFGSFVRESPVSVLDGGHGSFKVYDDAAIVVLSRSGGEGADLPTHNVPGHANPEEHYLQLDDNEDALIKLAKDNFDTVIVVINGANVMQIGDLAKDKDIDAILWMGNPGTNGALAVGKILTGEVNPSGRTADIYVADYKKDPTWFNFGDNSQTHVEYTKGDDEKYTAKYDTITGTDGKKYEVTDWDNVYIAGENGAVTDKDRNGNAILKSTSQYTLTYGEDIYMGYKYYETVDYLIMDNDPTWYDKNVVYPFGYGLSYTEFKQAMSALDVTGGDSIKFTVTVQNTGNVAGKEVVQIYNNPTYYEGGIEKASTNLVTFQKTPLLAPGEVVELKFEIPYYDLAAFDYDDANKNNFLGYEVEAGKYEIASKNNSHTNATPISDATIVPSAQVSQILVVADGEGMFFNNKGEEVTNTGTPTDKKNFTELSDGSEYDSFRKTSAKLKKSSEDTKLTTEEMKTLTRASTTSGKQISLVSAGATQEDKLKLTAADLLFSQEAVNFMADIGTQYVWEMDYAGAEWLKTEDDVAGWKQATDVSEPSKIQLWEMSGLPNNHERWEEFMNQLSLDEMIALDAAGGYQTIANARIGKPRAADQDGPAQLSNGYFWISEVTLACTWNTDLAYEQGIHVGNESILQDVNGWYGPAMNTHRSPFAGRNFEYYSQDGVHAGIIAANVVKGAREKGCHVYIKHFMTNDQETHRSGAMTWMTEQAAREIYFKPFELATIDGKADGIMTAFNKMGLLPLTQNRVMENILENEWGYKGQAVTDFYSTSTTVAWPGNSIIRGSTIPLGTIGNNGGAMPNGRNIEGVYVEKGAKIGTSTAAADCVVVAASEAEAKLPAYNDAGELQWTGVSPTQWYWIRMTAQKLLYTAANNNLMDNGVDTAAFADQVINAEQGVAMKATNIAEKLGGTIKSFEITSGTLPAGVTLNGTTGVISGTPSASGESTVTVTATVDNYISTTATITIKVASMFQVKQGTTTISDIKLTANTYADQIFVSIVDLAKLGFDTSGTTPDTITYLLARGSEMPEGMDASNTENGLELIGTPTVPGKYTVRVQADWVDQNGGSSNRPSTKTYYENITIEVAEVYHEVTLSGGDYIEGTSVLTMAGGSTLEVPAALTRAGHLFTGWYTDSACTTRYIAGEVNADMTIYAGWQQVATAENLTNTTNTVSTANGIAISGLVIGILGLAAGAFGVVMFFLGKKKSK